MQQAIEKISIFLMIVFSIIGGALRFVQLLNYTDSQTGLLLSSTNHLNSFIYASIILAGISAVIFIKYKKNRKSAINFNEKNVLIKYFSYALSLFLFYDFVHQCYNCYNYIETTSYVVKSVVIPIALVGIFALFSSFYYICVGLSFGGSSYDFRSFNYFHIAPIIWVSIRLLGILVQMVNVVLSTQTVIEFLFLIILVMSMFSFISLIEENSEKSFNRFSFCSLMTLSMAIIHAFSRIIMIVTGNFERLYLSTGSSVTDIAFSLFFVSVLYIAYKNSKQTDIIGG